MAYQRIVFDELTLNERYMVRLTYKRGSVFLTPDGIGGLDYQTSRAVLQSLAAKRIARGESLGSVGGVPLEAWGLLYPHEMF